MVKAIFERKKREILGKDEQINNTIEILKRTTTDLKMQTTQQEEIISRLRIENSKLKDLLTLQEEIHEKKITKLMQLMNK